MALFLSSFRHIIRMPELEQSLVRLRADPFSRMVRWVLAQALLGESVDRHRFFAHADFVLATDLPDDRAFFSRVADEEESLAVFDDAVVDEIGEFEFILLFGH
jgi:hypothetical protein